MYQYILFASLVALGQCRPSFDAGLLYGGHSGLSSGGWQGSLSLAEGGHEFEGAASSYAGLQLTDGHQAQQAGGGGGDYHHGVSIVGIGGGDHKNTIFDLTGHAGEGHKGSFGGSFVASGKYGGGHGGDSASAGYGVSENYSSGGGEFSDVLGASESLGGGGHLPLSTHEGLSAYHSDGAAYSLYH